MAIMNPVAATLRVEPMPAENLLPGAPGGTFGWRLYAGNLPLALVLLSLRQGWPLRQALAGLDDEQQARAASLGAPGRRQEYIISRRMAQSLRAMAGSLPPRTGTWRRGISHCRQWVGVALSAGDALGFDIECRAPRAVAPVAERLGWPGEWAATRSGCLHGWTAWEAWCKLRGGSVLDPPGAGYARVIDQLGSPSRMTARWIDANAWVAGEMEGARFCLAVRPTTR
ncbi:hypothetical protein F3N42_08715 [Marinihelvus fidelis]|uniref:4'-phosphopantetheinyl transferase superfamily protein n=1 Tax=Marinihelvus fidelis TaxID=2613842 RepID=A0A5N0T8N6_9GAMM|nr:hypothetical protein [Marinihelvus fidelis]KAA9131393.1 hypothetical protein F3N42_08715 [Marinihelvus fidelis]